MSDGTQTSSRGTEQYYFALPFSRKTERWHAGNTQTHIATHAPEHTHRRTQLLLSHTFICEVSKQIEPHHKARWSPLRSKRFSSPQAAACCLKPACLTGHREVQQEESLFHLLFISCCLWHAELKMLLRPSRINKRLGWRSDARLFVFCALFENHRGHTNVRTE